MKYLEDLISEAEKVKTMFAESKELIECCGANSRFEQIVNSEIFEKYDSVLRPIEVLIIFLNGLRECNNDDEVVSLMLRVKGK